MAGVLEFSEVVVPDHPPVRIEQSDPVRNPCQQRPEQLVESPILLFTAAQLVFRRALLEDPPQAVHQQSQVPDVRLVVILGLVSDARHQDDPPLVQQGDIHMPLEGDMPLWKPPLPGIGRCVIVGEDRPALADCLAPEAGLRHPVLGLRVDDLALPHHRPGPGVKP